MRRTQSKEIGKLVEALALVQGSLKPAAYNCTNPHLKNRYADMVSIWNSARDLLAQNELAVIQTMDYTENSVVIVTTLAHSSGQWIRGSLALKPGRVEKGKGYVLSADPQAIGTVITYGRRYSLAAIIGQVSDEDLDGEDSMDRDEKGQGKGKGKKSKDNFDLLSAIGDIKKIIDPEEYYEKLSKFKVAGKPVKKSNQLSKSQKENFLDNLKMVKARNERFIQLCLAHADKIKPDAFNGVMVTHDVPDKKLKDDKGNPTVVNLKKQKSILNYLESYTQDDKQEA